jgi:hypothetical protein
VDWLEPKRSRRQHYWIAPRDRNVVFYTDGENGKATPRAVDFSRLPEHCVAKWFNPQTGTYEKEVPIAADHHTNVHAPDPNDWALLVTIGTPR